MNIREDKVQETIKWLEGIENEERRKLVNALKRSEQVFSNPKSPKLQLARREYGEKQELVARVFRGERHGKTRFSIEFLPKNSTTNQSWWLSAEEALKVAANVKVERSAYPHRLQLAFIYLASKLGVKDSHLFRYSTDGDQFTKAYSPKDIIPPEDITISHDDALEILKKEQMEKGTEPEPAFGVAQTKVFRIAMPVTTTSPNLSRQNWGEESSQLLIIKKRMEENTQTLGTNGSKRAYYRCETFNSKELEKLRSDKECKIIWPKQQAKSLTYLLDLCQELILQQASKTLGAGEQHFAVLYQKKTELGPPGYLYKAIIAKGKDKTEASKTSCKIINQLWNNGLENTESPSDDNNKAVALTCLTSTDCALLKYLVTKEAELDN
jgi:hypothetical protein